MTILTLTAGTCFIMWLGEQITEKGVGRGASLIIFIGIAAQLPSGVQQLATLVGNNELSGAGSFSSYCLYCIYDSSVIFLEVGQRRIPIQYSQRGQGKQQVAAPQSHLPLKINFSGVIPPIFASSLLMFPATLTQFVPNSPVLQALQDTLAPYGGLYNVLFCGSHCLFLFLLHRNCF